MNSFKLLPQTRRSPSPSPPFQPNHPNHSNDIHQVFKFLDENGDGKITAWELKEMMRKVGGEEVELSDEEAEMVVRSSDADGDGVMGFDDFARMMEEGDEGEMREAFGLYAAKGGCVITPESLKKMMRRLGQSITVKDCKVMIGRFDVNGDGVLDFDEFRVMMS